MNPLLDFTGLPAFEQINSQHITPAIDYLLAENRTLIAQLAAQINAPTWEDFVTPLELANERLTRAWGVVTHLNAVMNSVEWRAAYNENLPKISAYFTELSQHPDLSRGMKALRHSDNFALLSVERQKVLDNELRDFRLGGAELTGEQQQQFREIQSELAQLSAKFEENVLDATNDFSLWLENEAKLAGLPEDVIQVARAAAEQEGKLGWKFTLHAPSFIPFMQYAASRPDREKMYYAYVTRASELAAAQWDNSSIMERIVALRQQTATLLGFASYADLSLATKMADTPEQIEQFLLDLAQRARPFAERDRNELVQFATAELGLDTLQSWDVAWVSEKLRQARYDFSEQEVKQYFPEQQVLLGLFKLIHTLYGLTVRTAVAPVWHADVRFYEIVDAAGQLIGQFYLDLYAREHKRGGAWMDDAITRCRKSGVIQTPVAYLTCNFSAPVGERPALFTHDEVQTLFHEFGHGLHHLMTQVEELGVSGIHGVEWDAVELPSQFMENFCWEWEVLSNMTRHVDEGTPLSRALFQRMLSAKNFQSGLFTIRQVELSLFDLRLHSNTSTTIHIEKTLSDVREQVAVLIPPPYNRFANGFSHIFAGGYAAGYYSYKWAEVLSADVYSLFEEQGVLSVEVGRRFWQEILAMGGARSANASFVAFRGREPNVDAFLRHCGMIAGT